LLDNIDRVARGIALAHGVPQDRLPIVTRSAVETTPPTVNDPAAAARVREAIAARMGRERLIETPRQDMGAEDFSYFVQPETGVRGVYFWVGGTPEANIANAPGHHSPLFRIQPQPSVTAGVEAMVIGAEALMTRGSAGATPAG
jgi:hippurate hydrolase